MRILRRSEVLYLPQRLGEPLLVVDGTCELMLCILFALGSAFILFYTFILFCVGASVLALRSHAGKKSQRVV